MVSGLTPPSKQNDDRDLAGEVQQLTEIVRFSPAAQGVADAGTGYGFGNVVPQQTASVGMFAIEPQECIECVILQYEETSGNTKDLEIGGQIKTSNGSWTGRLVAIINDELGTDDDGSGNNRKYSDEAKKEAIFEPTNSSSMTFLNSSATLTTTDDDGAVISGWTASYITNSTGANCLPLRSSTCIVKKVDGTSSDIRTISGARNDGQIITCKPVEGTTLTFKTGGNIDISADVAIADNEFALLQFFDDAGTDEGRFLLVKTGAGGGSLDEDATPTWTGNHIFQEDVTIGTTGVIDGVVDDVLTIKSAIRGGTHSVDEPDGGGYVSNVGDTLWIDSNLDMNTWNIYDVDSLYFAIGTSSTTPAHDTDGNGIDADGTGMNFYTRSGDDFKFFEHNEGEKFRYDGGDSVFRMYGIQIDMNSNRIINVSDPINNRDVVNKQWFNANQSSGGGISASDDVTWTGDHLFRGGNNSPVKFQGDNTDNAQIVVELGSEGSHEVKIIGELLGTEDRGISNPAGGSDIPVPGSDTAISMKAAIIMNTFTMYDLDTLIFAQGVSSTTPAPEDDWVFIEANTGVSSSPNLTGMHYNVPDNKSHQFKVNGVEELVISEQGLKFGNHDSNSSNGSMWYDGSNFKARTSSDGLFTIGSGGGGSSDNLGNHSATQQLDMNSNDITDCGNIKIDDGKALKAYDSTEIRIQVTNDTTAFGSTFNTGSYGTIQIPDRGYYNYAPSDSTLDGWFGKASGCIGIQRTLYAIRFHIKGQDGDWYYEDLAKSNP